MKTSILTIPPPLSPALSFRWFVEHVIDNSPHFSTASAIAKASLLLAVDLDTPGECDVNEPALALLRLALTDEAQPVQLPALEATGEDGTKRRVPLRAFGPYIAALLEGSPGAGGVPSV